MYGFRKETEELGTAFEFGKVYWKETEGLMYGSWIMYRFFLSYASFFWKEIEEFGGLRSMYGFGKGTEELGTVAELGEVSWKEAEELCKLIELCKSL